MDLLVLGPDEVRRALPMTEAIGAMRHAFRALGADAVTMPPRTRIELDGHDASALVMPASIHGAATFAVKTVAVHAGNAARGLPLIHGLVQVFEAATGRPLAVLDAAELTALRTAAVSGLATDLLARRDARTLALLGSGRQARAHLEAMRSVRRIEEVRVYSPTPAHRRRLADAAGSDGAGLRVQAVETPGDAVSGADIVCTATTSMTPVFEGTDVTGGVHINAVGSFRPTMQEVDLPGLRRPRIVVDQRAAALEEAGDLLVPIRQGLLTPEAIHASLDEVLSGRRPGRESADQVTYFKSVGLAVEDAAAAEAVLVRLGRVVARDAAPPP